jgi:hypothetical protein
MPVRCNSSSSPVTRLSGKNKEKKERERKKALVSKEKYRPGSAPLHYAGASALLNAYRHDTNLRVLVHMTWDYGYDHDQSSSSGYFSFV